MDGNDIVCPFGLQGVPCVLQEMPCDLPNTCFESSKLNTWCPARIGVPEISLKACAEKDAGQ